MWAGCALLLHAGVSLTRCLLPTTRQSFNNTLWLPVQPHTPMATGCRCILRSVWATLYSFQLSSLWTAAIRHDGCESCPKSCTAAANHCASCSGANLNSPSDHLLSLLPSRPTCAVMRQNLPSFAFARKLFLTLDLLNFCPATWRRSCTTPRPGKLFCAYNVYFWLLWFLAGCAGRLFMLVVGDQPAAGPEAQLQPNWTLNIFPPQNPNQTNIRSVYKTSPNSASVLPYAGGQERRAVDVHPALSRLPVPSAPSPRTSANHH